MKQVPSIGRIVHYILSARESAVNAGVARPAIIVRVSDGGSVGLQVFLDCHHDQASSTVYVKSAGFDEGEGNKPGTWRWPPYVAPTGDRKGDIEMRKPAPKGKDDLVEEIVAERTKANPDFQTMVDRAAVARETEDEEPSSEETPFR